MCRHPGQPRYEDQIYHSRLMAPSDTEKVLYGYYAGRPQHTVRSRAGALAAVRVTPGDAVTSDAGVRCQHC